MTMAIILILAAHCLGWLFGFLAGAIWRSSSPALPEIPVARATRRWRRRQRDLRNSVQQQNRTVVL